MKHFVLDTNVLLYSSESLKSFGDNVVVLPIEVIEELDKLKNKPGNAGRNAREVIRTLDSLREGLLNGCSLNDQGGLLKVDLSSQSLKQQGLREDTVDNRIISVTLKLQEAGHHAVLVTKDINVRVKARVLGVPAEDWYASEVRSPEYPGWQEVVLGAKDVRHFKEHGSLKVEGLQCLPNEILILKASRNGKNNALARKSPLQDPPGLVVPLKTHSRAVMGISTKNVEQRAALELLCDDEVPLVTLVGPAGTGKTLLALVAGLNAVMKEKTYEKVVVARPVVPMGRDIGYLPGTAEEKMRPWIKPILDNVKFILTNGAKKEQDGERKVQELLRNGTIEAEPLTYIRGRSIHNQFLLIDECLTAGHLVSTPSGVKPVEEVKPGDVVRSLNLETMDYEDCIVEGSISRTSSQNLEVKTTSIGNLECTKNHPFYVFADMKFQKKPALSLQKGDFVPSPRMLRHNTKNDLCRDLGYWLGLMLCDGHLTKNGSSAQVSFKKDPEHVITAFKKGVGALSPGCSVKVTQNSRGDTKAAVHDFSFVSMVSETYGIPLGAKSSQIKVPDQIWSAPLGTVRGFLSACFDTEGDVNTSGSMVINFSTTSKRFATEVQLLLKKFDVYSSMYVIKRAGRHRTVYRVSLHGREADRFCEHVGFSLERKRSLSLANLTKAKDMSRLPVAQILRERMLATGIKKSDPCFRSIRKSKTIYRWKLLESYSGWFSEQELRFLVNNEFVEIKGVSTVPGEQVYDFKVKGTGTFVVNGLVSSNCQNLTPAELKTIISRAGHGTKVVLTGDPDQIDNAYLDKKTNGLTHVVNAFKDHDLAGHVLFTRSERSLLASLATKIL